MYEVVMCSAIQTPNSNDALKFCLIKPSLKSHDQILLSFFVLSCTAKTGLTTAVRKQVTQKKMITSQSSHRC